MLAYPSWTQPAYGFSPYGRPQRDENGIFAPVTTDTVPLAARRAAELRLAGKNVQAIQQYRAVLAVMPDHRLINHNLGAMLMEAGEHEAALPYLERSLVDCRDLQPHISYGWALLGLGHAAKAHAFLAQAVGRFGHSHPYLNILRSRASSLLQQADAAGVAPVRKVFCIGHNKTGTTSIDVALRSAGYRAGTQIEGERLIDDWAHGRFERIIDLCCQGDAFQDIPFSLKHTYRVLDETFPGSKFILTVRSSSEEWFRSISQFHKKIVGKSRIPTARDLKGFGYIEPGWLWRAQQMIYGIDETTLYSPAIYQRYYETHNAEVIDYFKDRPDDLLVLNLAQPDAMETLCAFLGFSACGVEMPHENRT